MPERNRFRLLLVEDDGSFGSLLTEQLVRKGYSVVWSRCLREARRELAVDRFHLVLLDILLPDGSGLALGREIRSRHPGLSMVFLTSLGDPVQRLKGLQTGADDYVPKTSHFQEILLRIENVLRRRRALHEVPDRVRVGRADVDFPALEARVDGRVSALGPREAALLRYLVARRHEVVSRDEILDEVWSPDEYPSPRTVDNFIMKLRRILEEHPQDPTVLRTVWGTGYQLHLDSP